MDVKGKSAIITGAGSGINLAFAQLLLSKSCSVIIADIALTAVAKALLAQSHPDGAKVFFKHTDVTDWKQLADLFPFAALAGLGVPDIVVPGAGIFEPEWSSFFFGDPAVEDASRYRTIDINLVHPIKLTRLALSQFLAARKEKAAVIHISSIAGQIGRLGTPIYSATKFGINGFVRSLARIDPIFGIRVSAVAPGVIRTPLWEDHPEKLKMFEEGKDEWVEPEEVAEAMMRLVQDPKLPGGTILEVGAKNTRVVQYYGDPGPLGGGLKGHSLGRVHLLDDEMIEVLKKERDSGGEGGEI